MDEISAELTDIFRDVFGDDNLLVTRATRATDVPGWDSLMHVTLVLEVERVYRIRFSSREVAMLSNVGELQDLVNARISAR